MKYTSMLFMPCTGWQKNCIANKQVNSLITLLEHLRCEVKSFQHRSAGSEREIIQLITKVIQDEIVDQVTSSATFGILMDDMTNMTSKEQMILLPERQKGEDEVSVGRKCS